MQKEREDELSPSFETALERLEAIVHRLEEGEVSLAETLAHYEEGVRYLRQCYQMVEQAERKIELLTSLDAEGNPTVEPFDEGQAMSLVEKADSRGRRRSRKAAAPSPTEEPATRNGVDDDPRLF